MAEQSAGVATNFTPLEPFVHQVGGHSSMMKFDEISVCKPFVARENRFYEDLPSEMKAFTPEYRGVVYVSFEEDDEGFIYIIAHPDKRALERNQKANIRCNSSDSDSEDNEVVGSPKRRSLRESHLESVQKRPHRVRLRSGKIELVGSRKDGLFEAEDMPEQTQEDTGEHREKPSYQGQDTNKLTRLTFQNFIPLRMKPRPAVLEAIARKHNSPYVKVLPGLSGQFLDKPTRPSLLYKESIANPWSLHCHKQQLSKLSKTAKIQKFIVLENVAYQFSYPCILDLKMGTRQHGDDTPSGKRERIMAKVESSTSKTLGVRACGLQVYQQDSGRFMCRNKYYGLKLTEEGFKRELTTFLQSGLGLRTELIDPLIYKLKKLYRVIEKLQTYRFYSSSLLLMYEGKDDLESSSSRQRTESECGSSLESADQFHQQKSQSSGSRRPKVDVRMIDFAHTTYSGCPQDRLRTGPDKGYLFGIENLIKLLDEIKRNHTEGSESDN